MELKVVRKVFTEQSTIGDFLINDRFCYYSLEDKDRQRKSNGVITAWRKDLKLARITAIPRGRYRVITDFSNRFQKVMPLLLNVPDFDGIRIHNGNLAIHTEGCILIGFTKANDFVGNSKSAFKNFMSILNHAIKQEKVWITVE